MGSFQWALALVAGCSLLLRAQLLEPAFQNLTPNHDGSAVTFSSKLRLKRGGEAAGQYPHEKIFVWEAGRGLRLFAEQKPSFSLTSSGPAPAGDYRLLAALASADGLTTTAFRTLDDCNFGTACRTSVTRYRTRVKRAGQPEQVFAGSGSLSPNGRYLALGSPFIIQGAGVTVRDLESGSQEGASTPYFTQIPHLHFVANNGRAASVSPPLRQNWRNVRIDASGERIFFVASESGQLAVFDVARDRVVAELGVADAVFDISDDGSIVVMPALGGIWALRSDGSSRSLAAPLPAGETVREIAVSGDGSKAFAVTSLSRLLRLDLRTGTVEELVAATPVPAASISGFPEMARGGVYTLSVSVPVTVTGIRFQNDPLILLPGSAAADAPARRIGFQVPFDTPEGDGALEVVLSGNPSSPFQSALASSEPLRFFDVRRAWFSPVLHQDFRGAVTEADPAAPGEVIHLFGTGWGAVSNPPARGEPASARPLSVLNEPLDCTVRNEGREWIAQVLWAGLAPGWFGLYQADIRLPEEGLTAGEAFVCGQPVRLWVIRALSRR